MKQFQRRRNIGAYQVTWVKAIQPDKFVCIGCEKVFARGEMDRHHVVEHCLGGATERHNVLAICRRCHRLVEFDHGLRMKLSFYMGAKYGLRFYIRHPTARPRLASLIAEAGRKEADRQLKELSAWQLSLGGFGSRR